MNGRANRSMYPKSGCVGMTLGPASYRCVLRSILLRNAAAADIHGIQATSWSPTGHFTVGGILVVTRSHMHAGNGITDPAIQYGSYADYALLNGIIPQERRDEIQSYYPRCKELIEECNSIGGYRLCRKARAYCVSKLFVSILWYSDNINDYDIRKKCKGSLCYDMSLMSKYLAQDTVRPPVPLFGVTCPGLETHPLMQGKATINP